MPCTTILVGRKASYDGSTLIARNDDGFFDAKKIIKVKNQKSNYVSKIAHLKIELPSNPLEYCLTPSVDDSHGLWPANGINSKNVAMSATETITSNALVLGSDPYVRYKKAVKRSEKDIPGGIGEEDLVAIILPYISSAREGVKRLGELLEKYGTYEPNGIAFSDEKEIWWAETIGGHHFIARKVKDEEYVIMPNQFGIDYFDLDDAFSKEENFICSPDLKEFILNNHLNLNQGDKFNPRLVFGSHDDSDHVYNTPRAWYMGRYFNPRTYKWDGENADYTPESDDIPWSFVPEHKITVEDVKYILSSYYQGTPYNPYSSQKSPKKGIYRPIGINRTGVMAVLQIRPYKEDALKSICWICFGPNPLNAMLPLYTNVDTFPSYVSNTTLRVDTDTFFWTSRLIAALADPIFGQFIMFMERYQKGMAAKGHELVNKFDKEYEEKKDILILNNANKEICNEAKKMADKVLNDALLESSKHMKCGYSRSDN